MKVFLNKCKKIGLFWLLSFVCFTCCLIISCSYSGGNGTLSAISSDTSIAISLICLLIIVSALEGVGCFDVLRNSLSLISRNDKNAKPMKGFIRNLRILIIFNLLIIIALLSMFFGVKEKTKAWFIVLLVIVFIIFLAIRFFFIQGTFKLSRLSKAPEMSTTPPTSATIGSSPEPGESSDGETISTSFTVKKDDEDDDKGEPIVIEEAKLLE